MFLSWTEHIKSYIIELKKRQICRIKLVHIFSMPILKDHDKYNVTVCNLESYYVNQNLSLSSLLEIKCKFLNI